jgi:hypothetical protein
MSTMFMLLTPLPERCVVYTSKDAKTLKVKSFGSGDIVEASMLWTRDDDGRIVQARGNGLAIDVWEDQRVVDEGHGPVSHQLNHSPNQKFSLESSGTAGYFQVVPQVNDKMGLDVRYTKKGGKSKPRLTYSKKWDLVSQAADGHWKGLRKLNGVWKMHSVGNSEIGKAFGDAQTTASLLRSVYDEGYQFPSWSEDALVKNPELGRDSRVYYDEGDRFDLVQRLLLEREPVNIGMQRFYDRNKMQREFGWSTGFYGRYFERQGELAPNIAVYCRSLVSIPGQKRLVETHIINAIGYGFDHEDQPDFQFMRSLPRDLRAGEFRKKYQRVFEKIFFCAKELGLTTVVMSLVGGGFFSGKDQAISSELYGLPR